MLLVESSSRFSPKSGRGEVDHGLMFERPFADSALIFLTPHADLIRFLTYTARFDQISAEPDRIEALFDQTSSRILLNFGRRGRRKSIHLGARVEQRSALMPRSFRASLEFPRSSSAYALYRGLREGAAGSVRA